jgi:hypothetical protein
MEKEETKKTGDQAGEGAAKQKGSFVELCMSCCGKGMSGEMLKMCEGMGSPADMMKMCEGMGKNWKDMPTPSELRKMCKETC